MSEFELEDVPEWARKEFGTTATPRSEPSVLDYRGQTAWPLLVDAATVSTFVPGELLSGDVPVEERRDAESAVLRFAEPAFDGEQRKWSLTNDARKAVLSAIEISDLPPVLDGEKHDPLTDALRGILRGQRKPGYETTDMRALQATRVAASWLRDAKSVEAPSIEDLDRQIELRRLLAPFEHMVGRRPPKGTEPPEDRFFGRAKEMKKLRDYVGVVPPSSLLDYAARAASSVYHVFTPHDPMCIWGTGGAGKTTLIAHFMLEHAEAARARFPFAYLDFDRSTLSARNMLGLLAEMCQQVGAQFPELTAPMSELRREVAGHARKYEKNLEEAVSILGPYAQDFRRHVEDYLKATESLFEFARPFLLVLDTFEIVQYSPDQVSGLEYFIRAFSLPSETGLWPRMRLIISGRGKVSEFVVPIAEKDIVELGALDRKGSAAMLMAFAADAGKPVTEKDALRLVEAIAKAVGDKPKSGVRPLRLRLIGTVFQDEKDSSESGAALVDDLIAELAESDASSPPAAGTARYVLVDGALVRRILRRVKDRRVRALADPGLVVRRITREVILNVMVPATADPVKVPDDTSDEPPAAPWKLGPNEEDEIFEAFRREVSLVEPDDSDPNALRHRQDVRRDMLPLIRARRPKRFRAMHQLAYDHFREAVRVNPEDAASAHEALYHGLWLDRDADELDRLWRPDARLDSSEFTAGSRASVYLRLKSRKGRATVSAAEAQSLSPDAGLDWLASQSDELLKRGQLEETLKSIRAVTGEHFEKIGQQHDLGAVVARLLYRSGLWRDAAVVLLDRLAVDRDELSPSRQSLIRTWATIAARSGAPVEEFAAIVPLVKRLREPLARVEASAHLEIGLRRHDRPDLRERLRRELEHAAEEVPPSRWPREPRILRLAVLSSPERRFAYTYVSSTERLPRNPDVLRHVHALHGTVSFVGGVVNRKAGDEIDRFWRRERKVLLDSITGPESITHIRAIAAYDHSDWANPLGNAISRLLASDPGSISRVFDGIRKLPDIGRAFKRNDGPLLVQIAMDEGRLMDVVRSLARDRPPTGVPPVRDQTFHYPETAHEIARALLAWHELTAGEK